MNEHQNLPNFFFFFFFEKMVIQISVYFEKCKQIKNKLKPSKGSSHKCVNNYSLFSPSSSLILSSLLLESFSRISFESAFSQNSWQQLHKSEQVISFELHFCTIALRSCLTFILTHNQ